MGGMILMNVLNVQPKVKTKEAFTMENKKDKEETDIKKDEKSTDKKVDKKEEKKEAPVPTIADIKKQSDDFRSIPAAAPVISAPKPSVTKVYLGKYSSIEEAMSAQSSVASAEPSIVPFIKSQNDHYIVQLGSFSDKAKADALVMKLQAKGFNPKIQSSN